MIEAKGLSKFFGPFVAIQDITLSIPEGQIVAFLGPNGAGKSTTIRTLLNFLFPTQGTGSVLGLDIAKDSKEIRSRTGYLPGGAGRAVGDETDEIEKSPKNPQLMAIEITSQELATFKTEGDLPNE